MDVKLPYVIGDQRKEIRVTQQSGSGQTLHLYIDDYYQGQIIKIGGEWKVHLKPNSSLTYIAALQRATCHSRQNPHYLLFRKKRVIANNIDVKESKCYS